MRMRTFWLLMVFSGLACSSVLGQCGRLDSLLRVLNRSSASKQVLVLNQLSSEYRLNQRYTESLNMAKQAVQLAKATRQPKEEAKAWVNIARISYRVNPNADDVMMAYRKAIQIYNREKDELGKADTYRSFGAFFRSTSYTSEKAYLDSAVFYYQKALEIFEKQQAASEIDSTAGLLAEVFYEKGEEDRAIQYANRSLGTTDGTQFSKAFIIRRALQDQARSQAIFIYFLIGGMVLMGFLAVLLVRGMALTRRANKALEQQKAELIHKNNEIKQQKEEIIAQKEKLERSSAELEQRNQDMNLLNREILLQQHEIEMQNAQLGEKNEELKQQQEEILTQRDNLEKQAHELEAQKDDLQKSYKTITILSRIGQSITSSLNFKEIFDTLYGYVGELMPADGFRVTEYHPETGELEYKFNTESQRKKPLIRISMRETQNPAVWCVKNRRSILVRSKEDLSQYEGLDSYSINPVFNAMIYYPLLKDQEAIGAIGIYSKQENAYNHRHIDMIKTLAAYTTIAINNAETYEILTAAQAQLVESEKMAALGGLVAGVAHEINTPVGICVTAASTLDSKTNEFNKIFQNGQMKRKDLKEYMDTVLEGNKILMTNLRRAADLVSGFKMVAVGQSTENRQVFNLKQYLQETVVALKPEFKHKPYEIELIAEDILINSYAGPFSQILTNLVMNSLIHGFKNRDQGQIRIRLEGRATQVILTYTDDGNGMTPEVLDKIYEPFFTTNREGGGTGLGMNIVYNLTVQKLGGKLSVRSQPGQGVQFVFEIPQGKV